MNSAIISQMSPRECLKALHYQLFETVLSAEPSAETTNMAFINDSLFSEILGKVKMEWTETSISSQESNP